MANLSLVIVTDDTIQQLPQLPWSGGELMSDGGSLVPGANLLVFTSVGLFQEKEGSV